MECILNNGDKFKAMKSEDLLEYTDSLEPMTGIVIKAINQFCRYAQLDTEQIEKKLNKYILYRDYTGFSGFIIKYAKDQASLDMIEEFNSLCQKEMEELFISLESAFSFIPKELIYG